MTGVEINSEILVKVSHFLSSAPLWHDQHICWDIKSIVVGQHFGW